MMRVLRRLILRRSFTLAVRWRFETTGALSILSVAIPAAPSLHASCDAGHSPSLPAGWRKHAGPCPSCPVFIPYAVKCFDIVEFGHARIFLRWRLMRLSMVRSSRNIDLIGRIHQLVTVFHHSRARHKRLQDQEFGDRQLHLFTLPVADADPDPSAGRPGERCSAPPDPSHPGWHGEVRRGSGQSAAARTAW